MCSTETPKQFRKWKKKLLIRFEREYPTEFELACNDDPEFSSSLAKLTKGKNFTLLAQHSSPEIREEAVKKLIRNFKVRYLQPSAEAVTKPSLKVSKQSKKAAKLERKKSPKPTKAVTPDTNNIAKALLPRFKDDSYEIVHLLIKQNMSVLTKMFSTKTLVEQLGDIIMRKECNKTCLKTALAQLCRVSERIEPNSDSGKLASKVNTLHH
jgi:hypothetical protein